MAETIKPKFIDINTQVLPEQPQPTLGMNPKKFAMYLFIASVVMIFAAFTSGYLVRRAEGNWVNFDLPPMFNISSIVIVVSSITMHLSYLAAKKGNKAALELWISVTMLLGITFCVTQFLSWGEMVEYGVYLIGNPSGSFVYVISFVHGLHLISAIIALFITFLSTLKGKVNAQNTLGIELCTLYWHFLGVLWLYLFIFLSVNR